LITKKAFIQVQNVSQHISFHQPAAQGLLPRFPEQEVQFPILLPLLPEALEYFPISYF
jgi:hypothetical protein